MADEGAKNEQPIETATSTIVGPTPEKEPRLPNQAKKPQQTTEAAAKQPVDNGQETSATQSTDQSDNGLKLRIKDPRPQPENTEQKKLEAQITQMEKRLLVLTLFASRATPEESKRLQKEMDALLTDIKALQSHEKMDARLKNKLSPVEQKCNVLKARLQRKNQQQLVGAKRKTITPAVANELRKRAQASPNAMHLIAKDSQGNVALVTLSQDGREVQAVGNPSVVKAAHALVLQIENSNKPIPPQLESTRSLDNRAMRELRPTPLPRA